MSLESGATELRAAWDDLIDKLNLARNAIDSPDLHAPPSDERGLAEGYRYLLGYAFGAIERAFGEDPAFPYFRRAIQPIDRATIDNADALYLSAAIDGSRTYRIRGKVADHRHWHGDSHVGAGPIAPRYLIVEAHSAYAGDTGTLAELSPTERVITGSLDSSDLVVASDGGFEILLAPVRPADHTGNFIATQQATAAGTATARYVIVRALFSDWRNEVSPDLQIVQLGREGEHPPALDGAGAAARMRRIGDIVANQMTFWNEFYDLVLEAHGDRNGDGRTFMPRNGLNEPTRANIATGGGQSTNVYAGGVFDLGPDEALLVEVRVPVKPSYTGFHLANLWGESLDYANHVTSLSGHQSEADADGAIRYVIAHSDPGLPNWLDTAGLRKGFLTMRWTYPRAPDALPKLNATTLPVTEVRDHLPPGTRTVAPEERTEQIRIRQEHVQRRYRQY